MRIIFLSLITAVVAASNKNATPSANQLPDFREHTKEPIGILCTSAGAPVEEQDVKTLNKDLMNSEYVMDGLCSLVRERIPERVVHAGGTGAFGYFETTHDISHLCKAKMFSQIGKKTPVAIRISLSAPRRGFRDTIRGSRGIGMKFYTEEGNFDLTGFNLPIFSFRDPELVISLIHIMKTNPVTDLPDPNMSWDYVTLNPETLFANLFLLSDFGAPVSYTDMTAHPIHTYQVYNEEGKSTYMRFHFIPAGGAKYWNATEFAKIASGDPNYYAKDLYNKIANGLNPTWIMNVQILSEEDRKNANIDIFDVTQVLPVDKYPLHPVGNFVLNRNPSNSFADIEQLAFSPGNLVPGIMGSPDAIFKSRRFSYRDAQNYRLGSNFNRIPVNCPLHTPTLDYNRDGVPPLNGGNNGGGAPNYYPNSFNGPRAYKDSKRPALITITEKANGDSPPNFRQIDHFYTNELTDSQRTTFINNVVAALCPTLDEIKNRALKWFNMINSDFGSRVSQGFASCA